MLTFNNELNKTLSLSLSLKAPKIVIEFKKQTIKSKRGKIYLEGSSDYLRVIY